MKNLLNRKPLLKHTRSVAFETAPDVLVPITHSSLHPSGALVIPVIYTSTSLVSALFVRCCFNV